MSDLRFGIVVLPALVALAACTTPPPPPPPLRAPAVGREVHCWLGTPLSGPQPGPVPAGGQASQALRVIVRAVAVQGAPDTLLEPLAASRRLIAAVDSGSTLRAASQLIAGARAGEVVSAAALEQVFLAGTYGPALPLGIQSAALPPGLTASLGWQRDLSGGRAFPVCRETVALLIGRSADGRDLDVGLLIEDGRGADGDPRVELHVLRPFSGRAPLHPTDAPLELGLLLPSPFGGEHVPAQVALLVTIGPAPQPGWPGYAVHTRDYAACLGDLAREQIVSRELDAAPSFGDAPPTGPAPLLSGLALPGAQRGTLLRLAARERAPACSDLALGASDALVGAVSARVCADLAPREDGVAPRALAWALERAAIVALVDAVYGADELSGVRGEAPPVALELLRRHTGALALVPASLQQALTAPDLAGWRAQLEAGNRDLLEQGWPAARLRAWEWLAARGLTPPGGDPLGLESPGGPQ